MTAAALHWEKVLEPGAVAFLTGPSRHYFEPFLARERTVSEVARELQLAPNKLLYHVKKAARLGLLRVVREQQRAGKPIKTYRSSADCYFIPFEVTPAETLESWLMPLEDDLNARWVRSAAQVMRQSEIPFGLRLWRAVSGEREVVVVKPTPQPPLPVDEHLLEQLPILVLWSELWLDPDGASQMRQELLELYRRYARPSGQTRHLLRIAVTPLVD